METTTQTQAIGSGSSHPHHRVLIFPLPVQGHVNSMLNLSKLLALSGQLSITFINTRHNHRLLVCHTDLQSRFSNYSGFQFHTVPDGLPENHNRSGDPKELFRALETATKQSLKDLLAQIQPPVDCIIGDGILGFVFDITRGLQIPMIACRTISACALWVYYNIPEMVKAGGLPIKGEGDMDLLVTGVPGMEGFLRRRDLPSACRSADVIGPSVKVFCASDAVVLGGASDTTVPDSSTVFSESDLLVPDQESSAPAYQPGEHLHRQPQLQQVFWQSAGVGVGLVKLKD